MQNIKLKKLVVACQTAAMTTVTSIAVSTQASDVELYKAPQKSDTTLMFMLDVSGSMDSKDGLTESRLTRLKSGMVKLLQGDATTTPLPDTLITGLAEFDGYTGRINVEARALGDIITLPGNREVFKTIETFTQPETRAVSQSRTWSSTTQTRVQGGTRQQACTSNNGTTIKTTSGTKYWCNVSLVTNWGAANTAANTAWGTNTNTSSGGAWSDSNNPSFSGNANSTGVTSSECNDWNTGSPYACTSWVGTTKTASDFGTVTSGVTSSTISYGSTQNSAFSGQSDGTPVYGTTSYTSAACTANAANCTRTESRTAQITSTRTYVQSRTGSYTVTTTYYGTVTETHRKKLLRDVQSLQGGSYTPTAFAYAEVAAYMMGRTTKGLTSSGFSDSNGKTLIQDGNNYLAPASVNRSKQCNTQGIYFLTDGEPTYSGRDWSNPGNYTTFMKSTLGSTDANFCNTNQLVSTGNSWGCIGNYAKALLDATKNPAGVVIKTAVVGFGADFSDGVTGNSDVENAKKWGEVGQGGWYSGQSATDVVTSVKKFLRKLQKYIPPVTTGSVTIPVDNLDTQNIQPWGYFPQFDPVPDAKVTTWVGNLKKYQVRNNTLKDQDGQNVMIETGTQKGQSVDNPNDYWADQDILKEITKVTQVNGIDTEIVSTVRVGGALSRLKLGSITTTGSTPVTTERKIFTDRKIDLATDGSTYVPNPISSGDLLNLSTDDLKVNNTANNFSMDAKRGYLAALFGYNVTSSMAKSLTSVTSGAFNDFLTQDNATLRQMGAVMHSKPILITQKGTTKYDDVSGTITYDNRDDLIAFGTTQGLLHIVRAGKSATDPDAGKEVFVFAPNEMIEKQASGFLIQDGQDPTLQYGIDGQWTAYTEYVTKKSVKINEPEVTVSGGKQWLYGGLRMGGRSYYALDLSNITSDGGTPKLKFRIDPTGQACNATNGLGCMGQSWSKPTIAWVNWQGKRKLVMFVGGGYDSSYESSADYSPSSSNIDQGAGVYMFDADNGNLLWWASANAGSANTAVNKTYVQDMKRSVVSSIKTIDRNSDGLVDNLYFGDLGGQVWRVDLNTSVKAGVGTGGENFATRAVRILDMSSVSLVPRFYNTPTFTIHNSVNGLFAAVTVGSGNLSYPMSATTNDNDSIYVIYDKDVTRRNLAVLKSDELYTQDVNPSATTGRNLIKNTTGNVETALSNGGWYYPVGTQKRILNETVAIDSDLYVSIFDSSKDITTTDCNGGIRGESNASQFCLPYGACKKLDSNGNSVSDSRPTDIFLGKGNIGISFGGINRDRSLVLNLPPTGTLKTYTGKTKFISQRWYER